MDRYVNAPRVMFPWSLAYKDYRLQVVCFVLKVVICSFTRSEDPIVLAQPLLDSITPVPVVPVDEIFYVTKMMLPSIHPQFAMITVFEEAVIDSLLTGLAAGIIFDVQLNPECLHPDNTLICIPEDIIDSEPVNADNVIRAFREEVTGHVNHMTLADILH